MADQTLLRIKMLAGSDWDERAEARVALATSDAPGALPSLIDRYWTWHFDDSLVETARALLAADLSWEEMPDVKTPPVGAVNSPLGYALAHEDPRLRDAAFHVLDNMVDIPAGEVLIGEEGVPLWVDGFQMGRYPVTHAQYQRFIRVTGHPAPPSWDGDAYPEKRGDHPVTNVNCEEAEAYAAWAKCRLPRFEEWIRAVRGADERLFPWGNEIDTPRCNTAELGAGGTTPVGAFSDGVSPFGCYDMMGNVWEWTSTWYDDAQHFRVVCGGAWFYSHIHSTCTSFDFFSKEYAESVIGFRVAR